MALPPHAPDRLPAGLCVFGLTYACGMTWAGTPKANPAPLTAHDLLRVAARHSLSYLELPVRLLPGTGPAELRAFRAAAEDLGVGLILASGNVGAGTLLHDLESAAELGATVVRCTLSSVLCGDRRGFPGGWRAHVDACERALEPVVAEAERRGIAVALENHQDADSEDLLRLCRRFESAGLGVTLDCGNPLAVVESPLAFAERVAPYLRHAHLKDYRVYPAPNGYRLVRCALGEGVIPFPELFHLFDAQPQPVTRTIEMAALHARLIPFLEPTWWAEHAPRDVTAALPALEVVWTHLRPAGEEWRTPLERDAPGEELLAYEWAQLDTSVAHLRGQVFR